MTCEPWKNDGDVQMTYGTWMSDDGDPMTYATWKNDGDVQMTYGTWTNDDGKNGDGEMMYAWGNGLNGDGEGCYACEKLMTCGGV